MIGGGLDRLPIAAQIDSLTYEQPLQSPVRVASSHFVRRSARKARQAEGVIQTEALIYFRVESRLRPLATGARRERALRRSSLPVSRRQAVESAVRRVEWGGQLFQKRGLSVGREPFVGALSQACCRCIGDRWRLQAGDG